MVKAHGGPAAGDGARQSDAGNHAGRSAQGAPRRDDLHRAFATFPNQVNNVLCFPFIFRGALDCRRHRDQRGNEAAPRSMRSRSWRASRRRTWSRRAFDSGEAQGFGPGSLIPSPFDPRLILRIAPAVAKAAMESGVASRPIADFDDYHEQLERFAFRSGLVMKPVFAKAKNPAGPRDLCRRRGRARAARDPGRAGGEAGAADPGRPAVGGRGADQALRPFDQGRPGFRSDQSRRRSALSRPMCRPISMPPAGTASRRTPRARWCAPMPR